VHYHFVDDLTFLRLIRKDAFLENALVFDHRYGTGQTGVEQQLAAGYDVLLDIDWQGARQIRRSFPSSCTIFIVPPSLDVLRQRLTARRQDSDTVIKRRMQDAKAEISHWDEFEHLIINDVFSEALQDLHSIVRNGRPCRTDEEQRKGKILAELLETG
jgi:guanylate kinase